MCFDYRHVNRKMKPDVYPLPRLWDLVQKVAHHKWYVTVDVNWGFWSLPLHPDSREPTAILTPKGLRQFNICPFGIRNSPPEFQRMIDDVVQGMKNLICYVDDIVMYDNEFCPLLANLRELLQRFADKGLYLKISKLELFVSSVQALGFIVSEEGVKPNPKKVQGLVDAKLPRTKKQLRSFIGTVGFLRRFIPNCSEVLGPLTRLLRKGVSYTLTQECVDAFVYLKTLITEHTLLTAPRGEGAFVIACDASSYGLGLVLL